jgi:hypothetical protein
MAELVLVEKETPGQGAHRRDPKALGGTATKEPGKQVGCGVCNIKKQGSMRGQGKSEKSSGPAREQEKEQRTHRVAPNEEVNSTAPLQGIGAVNLEEGQNDPVGFTVGPVRACRADMARSIRGAYR